MLAFYEQALNGDNSTESESFEFFNQVISGQIDPIILSAVLGALKVKGETPDEIAGAARAMRQNALPFTAPSGLLADSCGTGGDGANTINISTTAAIVAAACGLTMTKHGNRSVSSKSGSADLLESFGVNLTPSPEQAKVCLENANICFFFAPQYHAGVKHAMPVRTTLKTRTIFNILGPLSNPAAPQIQLMGVYSKELLVPITQTLKLLGLKRAMVVYGSGLDEIALHGTTDVCELNNGEITSYTLSPADFGVQQTELDAIKGGTPDENASITKDILTGKGNEAHQNAVAINVAALLVMADLADDLKTGVEQAKTAMSSGQAFNTLQRFVEFSNG